MVPTFKINRSVIALRALLFRGRVIACSSNPIKLKHNPLDSQLPRDIVNSRLISVVLSSQIFQLYFV